MSATIEDSLNTGGLWSAADRGDVERVRQILASTGATAADNPDVNARNCLGCTPLLYACGSGHSNVVQFLLEHPDIDVNRRNNDRLTSFMLAMQSGTADSLRQLGITSWSGWSNDQESTTQAEMHQQPNAQEKMRMLIDVPATSELEWTRHDRWTALMEACHFGQETIVKELLKVPIVDLEAVNLRGQKADEVAAGRGYERIAKLIKNVRSSRENPEELSTIKALQSEVESLKQVTRDKLIANVESKYSKMAESKSQHEAEIEPLSSRIDSLQRQLDEAMTQRMTLITRHVREVKACEEEIRRAKKKLENFDIYFSSLQCGNAHARASLRDHPMSTSSTSITNFEKDFECSICMEEMRPPIKIFQCINGHVMCESCKDHPDIKRCPSCRLDFRSQQNLLRNIPMEKVARTFYLSSEEIDNPGGGGAAAFIAKSPSITSFASQPTTPRRRRTSLRNQPESSSSSSRLLGNPSLRQQSVNDLLEWM